MTALILAFALQEEFKHEDKPENLKALFVEMHAARKADNLKKLTALIRPLLRGDEARVRKALKEGVEKEVVEKILGTRTDPSKLDDATVAKAFAAPLERSEVQVHAATTEEIVKYEKGSVAFNEFPGGARRMAEKYLRAGVKFYEVEYLEPGNDTGMKFHLFYWDGEGWAALGPIWRLFKE